MLAWNLRQTVTALDDSLREPPQPWNPVPCTHVGNSQRDSPLEGRPVGFLHQLHGVQVSVREVDWVLRLQPTPTLKNPLLYLLQV